MKVLELILKDYKRMANRNNNKFIFKPKAKVNIILGSNGMGKSSLLKELLPNVEDTKKEYEEDGYKILTFEHNSRLYKISFSKEENKYSFIVDDEELNPSYNMKTFKRLIEETFNLSKEVFNLLIGIDNFSSMSLNERKKWFTEILSDTDYEYGLFIYNKARVRYRELTGMLKLIESKLLKEHQDLKNNNINKNDINNQIQYLINIKNNITSSLSKPDSRFINQSRLKEAIYEYDKLSNIEIDLNIDNKILTIKNKLDNIKSNINNINNQINQLSDALNKSEKIVELEKELIMITKRLKDFKNDNILTPKEQVEVYNTITSNYTELIDTFNGLVEFKLTTSVKDIPIIVEKITNIDSKLKNLNKDINTIEVKLKDLEEKKNHSLTCPKCNNIFNPDFNKNQYEDYLSKHSKLLKEITSLEKEKITLDKLLEQLYSKKELMIKLSNFVLHNEAMKKLFKTFTENKKLEFNTKEVYVDFKNYYYFLKDNIDLIKLTLRKNEIEEQLNFVKNINKQNKDKLESLLRKISDDKIKLIDELDKYNKEYNKLKSIKTKMDKKVELGSEIIELLKQMHNLKMYKYKEAIYKYNLNIIDMINPMVNELKDKVTSVEIKENKIKELEDEKKEYTERRKAISQILDALSPNKGLLAKGLVEFINSVIDDINKVISNIFDYDLMIKPIDLENGKLDFSFKLISKGNEITDISKGSSGMKEVIDLAFKLVSMNILGMDDYPLILDEFGRALDPVHRSNAYEYINELSNEQFSQVFIVTHNEDVFSRFPNANIVLLDKNHYTIEK